MTASKLSKKLKSLQGLHFLPLGGSGEIGMNANFYFSQGQWLMVDNGVTFESVPDRVLMTDIRAFVESINLQDLKGLVITHAHEDHVGAAAYLWPYLQCPIYATPFTAYIVRLKLKDIGLTKVPVIEVALDNKVQVGNFDIEFVALTHSIPEPNALMIRTADGNIFHTGDWKIDPQPLIGQPIDEERLKRIGQEGILALICDSTNVFEPGTSGSEQEVKATLADVVASCQGRRVIVSCFASNVARVQSCYEAAMKNGRKVCLLGRSLHRMVGAAQHCGYFPPDMEFIEAEDVHNLADSQVLIITTGSQAEPQAALTRMAYGAHRHISLKENDTVIFSSRVIPGNQRGILDLKNALILKNVQVIEHTHGDGLHVSGHPCRDELARLYSWIKPHLLLPVHGEDAHIQEHAKFGQECGIPFTARPHNGYLFHLTHEGAVQVGDVPIGRLALDGKRLIEAGGPVATERRQLLDTGFFCVAIAGSREKRKIVGHKIMARGIFEYGEEIKEWEQEVRHAISEAWHEVSYGTRANEDSGEHIKLAHVSRRRDFPSPKMITQFSELVEKNLYRAFRTKWKIRPFIQVHTAWI